jgi:predicted small metal-binding protein
MSLSTNLIALIHGLVVLLSLDPWMTFGPVVECEASAHAATELARLLKQTADHAKQHHVLTEQSNAKFHHSLQAHVEGLDAIQVALESELQDEQVLTIPGGELKENDVRSTTEVQLVSDFTLSITVQSVGAHSISLCGP